MKKFSYLHAKLHPNPTRHFDVKSNKGSHSSTHTLVFVILATSEIITNLSESDETGPKREKLK